MVFFAFPVVGPEDPLAGVSGFTAKEAESGGFRHVLAGVDDLACSEACEELVVAHLIHVVLCPFFRAGTPNILPVTVLNGAASGGKHRAVLAVNAVGDITVGVIHLALPDVRDDAIRVFVSDIVVVKEVGLVISVSASAIRDDGDGVDIVHGPSDLIDGVDALLYERGGTKPLVVLPVAHLEFHITHAFRLCDPVSERGGGIQEVGAIDGDHFSELT